MPVLVLQAFAVQRGTPGGPAQHKATRAAVTGGPGQIADPLEPEHRIVDEERDHRHAVVGIGGRRRDPVGHGAGFVDAFLQHLTVDAFLVEHHLVGIFGGIVLALRIVDPDRPEQPLHPEGAAFVRHDRHHVLADLLVPQQRGQDADKGHRGRDFALACALQLGLEFRQRRDVQAGHITPIPLGECAAQGLAPIRQIGLLLVVQFDEGRLGQVFAADRDLEAVAEGAQLIFGQFLLLVGDVHPLTGRSHAIALDRLDQQTGRLSLGVAGALEGGIDLLRVVTATAHAQICSSVQSSTNAAVSGYLPKKCLRI